MFASVKIEDAAPAAAAADDDASAPAAAASAPIPTVTLPPSVLDGFVSNSAYPSLERRVELAGIVCLLRRTENADEVQAIPKCKSREVVAYHVRQLMHLYAAASPVATAGLVTELQTKQKFHRHAPIPVPPTADLRVVEGALESPLLRDLAKDPALKTAVGASFAGATPAMQFAMWLVDVGRVLELARTRESPIREMSNSDAGPLRFQASSSGAGGDDATPVREEVLLGRFDELINSSERLEPTASIPASSTSPDHFLYYSLGSAGSLKPLTLETLAAYVYVKFRDSMPLGFCTVGQDGAVSRLRWSRAFGSGASPAEGQQPDIDRDEEMKDSEGGGDRCKVVRDVTETFPFISTARIPTASTNALLKNGTSVRLFCYSVRYLRDVAGCTSVWFSEDAAYSRVQEEVAPARSFAYFCALVQRAVLSFREPKPSLLLMNDPVIGRFLKDARDSVGQLHADPSSTPSLVPGSVSEYTWTVGVAARSTTVHFPTPALADPALKHSWVLLPSLAGAAAQEDDSDEREPLALSFPLRVNPHTLRQREARKRLEAAEPSHLGVAAESLVSDADKHREQAVRSEAVMQKCCAETKRELLNWAAQAYLALEVTVSVRYLGDSDTPEIVISVRGPTDVLSRVRLDAQWGTTWQANDGRRGGGGAAAVPRISDALGELVCVRPKGGDAAISPVTRHRAATCHDFTAEQYHLVRHLLHGWNGLIVTGGAGPSSLERQPHPAAAPYSIALPQSMRRDARDHPLRSFGKLKASERLLPEDLLLLAQQTAWLLAQLPGRVQSGARFSGMRWQDVARWVPSSLAFFDLLRLASELQDNLQQWTTFVRDEDRKPLRSAGQVLRDGAADAIPDHLRESVATWPIELTKDGTTELFHLMQPVFGFLHQFLRLHLGWDVHADVEACQDRARRLTRLQPLHPAWNDVWNTHRPALHIHMALQKATVTEKLTNLSGFEDFQPQAEKEDYASYCARFRDGVHRAQSDASKGAPVRKALGNSFRFLWSDLSRGALETLPIGKLDPFEALFVRGLYDERLYMAGVRWLAWKTEHPSEVDPERTGLDAVVREVQGFAEELQDQHLAVCSLPAPLTQALVNEYNAALGSPTMCRAIALDLDQLVLEEFTQVIGVATANDTRLEVRVRGAGAFHAPLKVHIPHSTLQRWLQPEDRDHHRTAFIRPLLVAFGEKLRASKRAEARDCLDRIDSLLRTAKALEDVAASISAAVLPLSAGEAGPNAALVAPPPPAAAFSSPSPSSSSAPCDDDGPQPMEVDFVAAAPAASAGAMEDVPAGVIIAQEPSENAVAPVTDAVDSENVVMTEAAEQDAPPLVATPTTAPTAPIALAVAAAPAEAATSAAAPSAATSAPAHASSGAAASAAVTHSSQVKLLPVPVPVPVFSSDDDLQLSQSLTQPLLDGPTTGVASPRIEEQDVVMAPDASSAATETPTAEASPAASGVSTAAALPTGASASSEAGAMMPGHVAAPTPPEAGTPTLVIKTEAEENCVEDF